MRVSISATSKGARAFEYMHTLPSPAAWRYALDANDEEETHRTRSFYWREKTKNARPRGRRRGGGATERGVMCGMLIIGTDQTVQQVIICSNCVFEHLGARYQAPASWRTTVFTLARIHIYGTCTTICEHCGSVDALGRHEPTAGSAHHVRRP